MCKFFSLVSEPQSGRIMFFDAKIRRELKENNPKGDAMDSHTSIADYFGFPGKLEDALNKYEYDPFFKKLKLDRQNSEDDFEKVRLFCESYDFSEIIKDGNFSLDYSGLTSAKGLALPEKIGGYLGLGSLTSAEGLTLPEKIGGNLNLCSLKSAKGLTLPEKIGRSLNLNSLASAEGLTLPKEIGGSLYLDSLASAEGLTLPKKIGGSLYLFSLTSAEGLTLPKKIGGNLHLDFLKSAEKDKLRKKYPKIRIY